MKKILLILSLFIYSFSLEINQDFLEPKDAFKTSFTQNEDSLNFKLALGKDIYLYDDKLTVFITKPEKIDIKNEINIPEPVPYDEFIVHLNDLDLMSITDDYGTVTMTKHSLEERYLEYLIARPQVKKIPYIERVRTSGEWESNSTNVKLIKDELGNTCK